MLVSKLSWNNELHHFEIKQDLWILNGLKQFSLSQLDLDFIETIDWDELRVFKIKLELQFVANQIAVLNDTPTIVEAIILAICLLVSH